MNITHPALPQPHGPVPSPAQLTWLRSEIGLFVHFGVNTYTDREWGDGTESPANFNPRRLDTDQWAEAARDAGAAHVVLTCKHHDGFCLWPTAHTDHSVRSAPWRSGRGDVVGSLAGSCRRAGVAFGTYLSPWDRHDHRYGNSEAYNAYYLATLRELLSNYGPLRELWFDGAITAEDRKRGQKYDFDRIFALCRELQPDAVTFGDGGTDARWIGNERGVAGDPCWASVRTGVIRYPGDSGLEGAGLDAHARWAVAEKQLQHGDADGDVFRPAEADVSIRPGWFYHGSEDCAVRSVENLMDLYFKSVGRNAFMLLNVPPTRDGLFHDIDVARLRGFRAAREKLFASDLAAGAAATVSPEGHVSLTLPQPRTFSVIDLREMIELGQRIAAFRVLYRDAAGTWQWLVEGSTIGNRRLERLALPVTTNALRVEILRSRAAPVLTHVGLYAG